MHSGEQAKDREGVKSRGNDGVNTSVNLPLQEEVTTERINLNSKQL